VLAIAEALTIQRTLAEQTDSIVASVSKRARRADWLAVLENAGTVVAEMEN
jgi:hypothetical protein